jgi:hypothetical protein
MMKLVKRLGVVVLIIVFMTACGHKKHHEADHNGHGHVNSEALTSTEVTKATYETPQEFREQLTFLFKQYLEVKDALVEGSNEKATRSAESLQGAAKALNIDLLKDAAYIDVVHFQMEFILAATDIGNLKDVEEQRNAFVSLTKTMYESIKAFGLDGTLQAYYDFCPMAFDDKGAHWLSHVKEIRNPYFGDKMLTCGMVQEVLK